MTGLFSGSGLGEAAGLEAIYERKGRKAGLHQVNLAISLGEGNAIFPDSNAVAVNWSTAYGLE